MVELIPDCENLSVEEIDEKLEEAVLANERSHCHISFYLLAMKKRIGHQRFGFVTIHDYAAERFGYSYRMTSYMLGLARKVKDRIKIAEALNKGEISWTKAYKIASVATDEDEDMWLEAAQSLSVRMLDRKVKDNLGESFRFLKFSLSEDQAAVVEYAMEICRRVSGAELTPEQCLESMASEFLATWAQPAEQEIDSKDESIQPRVPEVAAVADTTSCPENGDLPSPTESARSPDKLAIFERDGWQCAYPSCTSRSMLHEHHIEFRSKFGKKRKEECDDLSNRTSVCAFHHRLVHAGIVSVKGEAPDQLEWGRPKKLEEAIERFERKRRAQEEEEAQRRESWEVIDPSFRKTFSEFNREADSGVLDKDDEVEPDDEDELDDGEDVNVTDWTAAFLG